MERHEDHTMLDSSYLMSAAASATPGGRSERPVARNGARPLPGAAALLGLRGGLARPSPQRESLGGEAQLDPGQAAGRTARRTTDLADRSWVVVEHVANPDLGIEAIVGPARRHLASVLESYPPEQLELLIDFSEGAAPALHAATGEIRTRRSGAV